jgi:hypothetical protein
LIVVLRASLLDVAYADAKLLGFDEPGRIPDEYVVVLNETLPWHRKLDARQVHSDNSETVKANADARRAALQADAQIVDRVARELASAYHGALGHQMHTVLRGFEIKMSERDARAMAKDSRIESITANHIIGNVWGNQ